MPQFSRRTILAATDVIALRSHAQIDRFLLEYGLEDAVAGYSKADKATALGRHLMRNPEAVTDTGENLTDVIVRALVADAISSCHGGYPAEFRFNEFRQGYADLNRGLERDGFMVDTGQLRRTLPDVIELPQADDEVHALLNQYGFAMARGHLDQGIAAHAQGNWAAANAQFRPFIESLFDSIAEYLAQGAALPPAGNPRRIWLANRNPPFLMADLNEWTGQGTGFMEGFFRRLHPAGAHPGLSDEEDSTFRLHLVLLVARLLLRRLAQI
jgi:hypothetical protein